MKQPSLDDFLSCLSSPLKRFTTKSILQRDSFSGNDASSHIEASMIILFKLIDEIGCSSFLDENSDIPNPVDACNHRFARNELIFHCKDCAVDETCVLCSKCFQKSDHFGHRVRYYLSQGSGGSCDCGESESWKTPLSCPNHCAASYNSMQLCTSESNDNEAVDQGVKRKLHLLMEGIIHDIAILVMACCCTVATSEEAAIGTAMVLYNDEDHSFPQVIQALMLDLNCSEEEADSLAQTVDKIGFAVIKRFPDFDPDSIEIRGFGSHTKSSGLVLIPQRLLIPPIQRLITGLLISLLKFITQYSHLKDVVIKSFFTPIKHEIILDLLKFAVPSIPPKQEYNANDIIFILDNKLWKSFRTLYPDLLTNGLAYQDVKMAIMRSYVLTEFSVSTSLAVQLFGGGREPHLSALNFTVQILTVPSIAAASVNEQLPLKILENFRHISSQFAKNQSPKAVKRLSKSIVSLSQMLSYICSDELVKLKRLIQTPRFWTLFVDSFAPLQGILQVERKVGDHVVYETAAWIPEANITVLLTEFIQGFSNYFINLEDVEGALSIAIRISNEVLVPIQGSNVFSFQQPLLWIIASLQERYLKLGGKKLFILPENIVNHVGNMIATLFDIKNDKWVRNGAHVAGQVFELYLLSATDMV